MGDLNPLSEGLVLSIRSGKTKIVFRCACGREQSYAPADRPGGITIEEAESFGWRRIDGKWVCPFCSGNTKNLERIFRGGGI